MSREMTSAMQSALGASLVRPAYFYELEFGDSTVRLWSGFGDFSWDGQTWLGNGWLRSFGAIDESAELQATGVSIQLSGVPDELVALILNDARPTNRATIFLGLLDDSRAIVADPITIFEGKLDVPEISDSAEGSSITITYESDLLRLETARDWRYTKESQQSLFPGDKGFDYTAKIEDWSGFWGRSRRDNANRRRGRANRNR